MTPRFLIKWLPIWNIPFFLVLQLFSQSSSVSHTLPPITISYTLLCVYVCIIYSRLGVRLQMACLSITVIISGSAGQLQQILTTVLLLWWWQEVPEGKLHWSSLKATSTTMAQASRKSEADLALDLICFNCRLQLHKGSHNSQKILCNSKDFRIHHDPKLDGHKMWNESRVCVCCVPGLHCSLGTEHGTQKPHTAHGNPTLNTEAPHCTRC